MVQCKNDLFLLADKRECFNKNACCKKFIRRCRGNGLVAKRNSQKFTEVNEHGAAASALLCHKQNFFRTLCPKWLQIFRTLSEKFGQCPKNIRKKKKKKQHRLTPTSILVFQHSCHHAGGLNCPHTTWDYKSNSTDGECMVDWAAQSNLALLYNPKDAPSFYSGRWSTGNNPDLAFKSTGNNSLHLHRRILDKFPTSQHRPSLITAPKTWVTILSEPYKRWKFRKADRELYSLITNKLSQDLPSPDFRCTDEAYHDFCNTIITAAKQSILRGRRKNYKPCWDAECEHLYQAFLDATQGQATNTAAYALLDRLDEKQNAKWSEAVNSIDFTHSSRSAWSTINNLTGKQRHTQRTCPISANSIASELVKNGTYKMKDRKSARLVSHEVSELWRIPTPKDKVISEDPTLEEFSKALRLLKPGKSLDPDSICPEPVLYAGAALKSWLNQFLSSCMRTLKLSKIWRRALGVAILKPKKPPKNPKTYRPISVMHSI